MNRLKSTLGKIKLSLGCVHSTPTFVSLEGCMCVCVCAHAREDPTRKSSETMGGEIMQHQII